MFQCHKLHMHLFITGHHVIPEEHTWSKSKGMGWTTKESWNDFWQGQEIFHLSKLSTPALGPTQPPIQRILETHSPEVKWLTTHII